MTVNIANFGYRENDIAVIGVAGRFPEADKLNTFWENIISGRESIRPLPESRIAEFRDILGSISPEAYMKCGYLEQVSYFSPEYFNISTEECKFMDPQQRLLTELVEEVLQDAGYAGDKLAGAKVGVFMADSRNLYRELIDTTMPLAMVNSIDATLAGRIAYIFNFFGPTLNIDTACSSSLTALHYACQSLQNKESTYAITGGVKISIVPQAVQTIARSAISSPHEQVRSFDQDADGTVGGEGGAVLLLKPLLQALADGDNIHAIIKGSAVNSDGRRSNGLSAPNPDAQAEVILQALANAGIDPQTISYIETHGTGTKLGDPIEIQGITSAFASVKRQSIAIGSLKPNIGHLDAAAGVANVVKVILALQHKKIPPSINYEKPNPHINFLTSPVYVNTKLTNWESVGVRRAGVTALGLTGTNVHVILEEAPSLPAEKSSKVNLFALSAQTEESLVKMSEELASYLLDKPLSSLDNLAYTLNTGRPHFSERIALMSESKEDLLDQLRSIKKGLGTVRPVSPVNPLMVEPVFIYTDLAEEKGLEFGGFSHLSKLWQKHYEECLHGGAENSEIKYFAFQYAYSKLLMACGLKPKGVLGIGRGKFVADVIKAKLSLEDGLKQASQYQKSTEPIPEERLRTVIKNMLKDGHNLFTLIGKQSELKERIEQILREEKGIILLTCDDSPASLYAGISRLYLSGLQVNWDALYWGEKRQRISLPTYVFDRKSYIVERDYLNRRLFSSQEVAVSNPREKGRATFEDILGIFRRTLPEEVKLDGDFTETGGDSLAVMQIAEIIKKDYQISVPLSLFYAEPTINALISEILHRLNGGEEREQASTEEDDFRASLPLKDISLRKEEPEGILLTGGTGFFGAHLLRSLLQSVGCKIYCLVRGNSAEEAEARLREKLSFYFGSSLDNYFGERIMLVNGDITSANLGLSSEQYQDITAKIDCVLHSAADVRHYGQYAHFARINVEGVQNLIAFCLQGKIKKFHHVSTLAVAGRQEKVRCFAENDFNVGQSFTGDVYGKSKYEAEKLILKAREQGLPAAIYRIGNLTGRLADGVFQKNTSENTLYNSLKALTTMQQIPISYLGINLELTPVDRCSEALVRLLLLQDSCGQIYHLMNPRLVTMRQLREQLNLLNYQVKITPDGEFYENLQRQVEQGFEREISLLFNAFQGRRNEEYPTPIFTADFTINTLRRLSFEWPDIDSEYLRKVVGFCEEVGYIG